MGLVVASKANTIATGVENKTAAIQSAFTNICEKALMKMFYH